ncbi:MAG: ABC transporter ATP-binding protein [Desulfobacterales bacterium]|jgi:ABC-type lipoprotein export system ATPase subunit
MTLPSPLISAVRLERTYALGDTTVTGLGGIDFEVEAGAFVVLKGVSGSGKSTLLSLLAGLDRPTGGELVVDGSPLNRSTEGDLTRYRREVIGVVFQSFNLLPTLSVIENVCLPALLAGIPSSDTQAKARHLLDWLGIDGRIHHRPYQLSGGEMQRTAIARALINDPKIVLADEPTGNLDSRNGRAVVDLLADLNRSRGRTVVIATHGDQADRWATQVLRLKDGKLEGDPWGH